MKWALLEIQTLPLAGDTASSVLKADPCGQPRGVIAQELRGFLFVCLFSLSPHQQLGYIADGPRDMRKSWETMTQPVTLTDFTRRS